MKSISESTTLEFNFKAESADMTVSLKKFTINTVREANIDDNEEYLKINNTITQVNINKKHNCNDKADIIPKYVATPLPTLNLSQTGNICPRNVISTEK